MPATQVAVLAWTDTTPSETSCHVPSPQLLPTYLPPGKYDSLSPELVQNVLPVTSAAVTGLAIAGAEGSQKQGKVTGGRDGMTKPHLEPLRSSEQTTSDTNIADSFLAPLIASPWSRHISANASFSL